MQKDYGRHSSFFRGGFSTTTVPADLKQLVDSLTEPTEYQMWLINWKKLLKNILPTLLNNTATATDNNGNPISLKHLIGEGTWETGPTQAADIPALVLDQIKAAAKRAFFQMQPSDPLPPYSTIFQSPNEIYCSFIGKLTKAVELQVRRKNARQEVLKEMAFSNANDICKAAIITLPHDPAPTLQDMLQVCNEKVSKMDYRNLRKTATWETNTGQSHHCSEH